MWRACAAGIALVLAAAAGEARGEDRLARFAELGRVLAGVGEQDGPVDPDRVLAEMFHLVDTEILDSLRAGEPFASAGFIQDRLDGFMATWGGAKLRVHRLGGAREKAPITVGVFSAPGPAPRGWVRVYGAGSDGEPRLLATAAHDGAPEIYAWPPARDGAAQFAATWLGGASGTGGRPLVIEVWRRQPAGGVARVWSSAAAYPDGLWVLGLSVKDGAITIRYEGRYPGWTPGCPGQTELTDLYRWNRAQGSPTRVARRVVNGWHRDLHGAVDRLLAALQSSDEAALAKLVPDRALRGRLPRALIREPACDAPNAPKSGAPTSVAVAVTDASGDRPVPWSLTWRRAGGQWRLSRAEPMLK